MTSGSITSTRFPAHLIYLRERADAAMVANDPLWSIFWDATIAIAAAVMITEIIASLRWAFS
jgi:hypothetical protein